MTLFKMLPVLEGMFKRGLVIGTVLLWASAMFGACLQIGVAVLPDNVALADAAAGSATMWLLTIAHMLGNCLVWQIAESRWRRAAPGLFFVVTLLAGSAVCFLRPAVTPLAIVSIGIVTLCVAPHVSRRSSIAMSLINIVLLTAITLYTEQALDVSVLSVAEKVVHTIGTLISRVMIFMVGTPVYHAIYHVLLEQSETNAMLRTTELLLRNEVDERQKTSSQLQRQNSYLAALNETSKGLVQRMDKKAVVESIVKRACELVNAEHAFVSLLTADNRTLDNAVSIGLFAEASASSALNVRRREGMSGRVLQTGAPIVVDDHRAWAGAVSIQNDPVRAIVVMPLSLGGTTIGVLGLAHTAPDRRFDAEQISAIERFAGLAAVALDNAALYEASKKHEMQLEYRVSERTRELSAMLNIANVLSSTFDLDALLGRFFEELVQAVPATSGAVFVVQSDEQLKSAYCTERTAMANSPSWPLRGHLAKVVHGRAPIIINDVHRVPDPRAEEFRALHLEHLRRPVGTEIVSWMGVPIVINDKAIGLVALEHRLPNMFTTAQAELALAMSQQAALAIENARLHTQTVQAAAAAERSRLARDLHDSVSQAVFGISLGVRSIERLAIDDPARAFEPLPYVLSLADAALTEMRALIFELRPESLEQEGLLSALQKQIAATRARHSVTVSDQLCAREPAIDLKLKEALYRVALEAMHNAVKYARCSQIDLVLRDEATKLVLEVSDNGIGFDPANVPQGHYGLKTMRERMTQLNGSIDIDSAVGHGARIVAHLPKVKVLDRFGFGIAPAV